MSNIYIQEPPTHGKVLLITSVGDIEIELWAREAPKACRNFVQLCMEGYYNGTIFHRVVKKFIVQGGDPTGTGEGGESIYGHPFKDEFHTRLRFNRRGLVAMANAGKDDNGSQFFFTLGDTPELQNKHTIFGKVVGDTMYNMLKLEEGVIDHDERPEYPQKIIKTEILFNPFQDIVPRVVPQKKEKKKKSEQKKTGVKNFKLLSFGEEAEEDEEENKEISMSLAGKAKSTHDVLNDPKLSSVPAVEAPRGDSLSEDEKDTKQSDNEDDEKVESRLSRIRQKLKRPRSRSKSNEKKEPEKKEPEPAEDEDLDYYLGKEKDQSKKLKMEQIKNEIKNLKKEYHKDRKEKVREEEPESDDDTKKEEDNEIIEDYKNNLVKYSTLKKQIPKGKSREEFTMALLAKFQKKLESAKEHVEENPEKSNDAPGDEDENWLTHKLSFDSNGPVLAKDASTKADDWFDITDPRNPINKRRREAGKSQQKK